ncbi:hypothetical protein [Streptomyces boluensis]|uniref:Lipoprotein n=1 Tax=Streptomyces boluensis TaxID=1775135 RepID=A0A964XPL9_9ACTN|nr:hypothetical protein [Streptomyces boluensis]NBE55386.1 hypothetical protein [Streptomyces boluensis]
MRAVVRGSAGVMAACALTASAVPVASAADNSWHVSVSPRTVAPGGQVTLSSSGCQVPSVTADAAVFDTTELDEGHSAIAHVFADAKPGAEYEVTFTCKGKTKSAPLMISGGQSHSSAPHRGVKAGAGNSFTDISPTQLALGGALVAGALGFAVVQVRRRGGTPQ